MRDNGWYNADQLPGEMVRGARAEIPGWTKLEHSQHFKVLNDILSSIDIKSVIDIGCGSAEFGRVYPNLDYLGCDLQHIVENVSKVCNPNLQYMVYDAYECEDYSFVEHYDLLIMSGFLSEMEDPLNLMSKIIKTNIKYILIHRQDFTEDRETYIENYATYAKQTVTNSYINFTDFLKIIEENYVLVSRVHSGMAGSNKETLLIKSKKIINDTII